MLGFHKNRCDDITPSSLMSSDTVTIYSIWHLEIWHNYYIHTHTYTDTRTHIRTTFTYLLTDFDECADGIGCYSRYLFPFGDETEDISSGLTNDGSIAVQLNIDFVFHSTNHTTVFVSLKLVTCFLVLIIVFHN